MKWASVSSLTSWRLGINAEKGTLLAIKQLSHNLRF